jgi:AsmA protein
VVSTTNTRLNSPFLRVVSKGKADLNKEILDFRVEPKIVATLKGQGDAKERSGIMVPVLVTGSFASPSFRPDLKGVLQQQLDKGIPTQLPDIQKSLTGGTDPKDASKGAEDQVKGLLKGLPFKR